MKTKMPEKLMKPYVNRNHKHARANYVELYVWVYYGVLNAWANNEYLNAWATNVKQNAWANNNDLICPSK